MTIDINHLLWGYVFLINFATIIFVVITKFRNRPGNDHIIVFKDGKILMSDSKEDRVFYSEETSKEYSDRVIEKEIEQ